MSDRGFRKFEWGLVDFLTELEKNNRRQWYKANQDRYEQEVIEPVFAFIQAMRPRIHRISPYYRAVAKKVGGSMMRIHRDTRFSKDKTPFNTQVGIRFTHEDSKKVFTPGFYVRVSPRDVFIGIGCWHPDSRTLARIRASVDSQREQWLRARDDKKFRAAFTLGGGSLKQTPRGYPKDHPLLEDLKRKDFVGFQELTVDDLLSTGFLDQVADSFTVAHPLMRFLCDCVGVPF